MESRLRVRRARAKRNRKIRIITGRIIFFAALAVFLFSLYRLYGIFSEYRKGDKEYEGIIELAISKKDDSGKGQQGDQAWATSYKVDFAALLAENKQTVAWIRFDEPSKISYPVVKAADNDRYLHTTFYGKKNSSGAIFMDAACQADFSGKNTFIYGHNMKNGSMFGQLRKYRDKNFFQSYPYFYIYTPDGRSMRYQIFAVEVAEDSSASYEKNYADDEAYAGYLGRIKKSSLYDTGVDVNPDSTIVSLSTCTNVTDTQRLIVHGVLAETVAAP